MKTKAEVKAATFYSLALENYETWGDYIVECETLEGLTEKFANGTYKTVRGAVAAAKEYAAYADEIKATAW